jgi:hypothetical protein
LRDIHILTYIFVQISCVEFFGTHCLVFDVHKNRTFWSNKPHVFLDGVVEDHPPHQIFGTASSMSALVLPICASLSPPITNWTIYDPAGPHNKCVLGNNRWSLQHCFLLCCECPVIEEMDGCLSPAAIDVHEICLTLSLAAPFAPPCLAALGLIGPRKKE